VSRASAIKLAADLAKRGVKRRAEYPGIGPRRAEIVVAGTFVFAEMMTRCGIPVFRYSPLGLRDGLLAQMAADADPRTTQHQQLESERQDALLSTCRRYGVDLRYAEHVRELALQLFDSLKELHDLPSDFREWISAAALLHEVGSYVNRSGRHRHAFYIISNSEIFGFTTEQRRLVAAVSRYLGKSYPTNDDAPLKKLNPLER